MNKRVIILEPSSKVTNAEFKRMLGMVHGFHPLFNVTTHWDVHIATAEVTYEKLKSKSKARNR
jgi:hypothetical protein